MTHTPPPPPSLSSFAAQYFIARPYAGSEPQQMIKTRLARGNSKAWQLKNGGLDIGHRGAGSARRTDRSEKVLENTVDSFNYAFKKGADMVELDVQISKDKVPVVYHDFNVNIVLQKVIRGIILDHYYQVLTTPFVLLLSRRTATSRPTR